MGGGGGMGEQKLHLVAFVAHPIDEVKCVGGTFAKSVKRGHRATAVIFSRPISRGNYQILYQRMR
jgi:LmbE family N-acetylglucosaminyl deacetylase